MKKSLIIMIGLILAHAGFGQNFKLLGDTNSDEVVDIVDSLLIAQHYVKLSPPAFIAEAGDVNCSGETDIVDALLIAQFYVKLLNSFPCTLPTASPTLEPLQKNMGLTIYFVRHAQTVANASGEFGGSAPIEDHDKITALGYEQIEALKNFLIDNNIKPDFVAVSPSTRCQETIEPLLIAMNMKAEIWVSLNECCHQDPTGAPLPEERPESFWKLQSQLISSYFELGSDADKYLWLPQTFEEGMYMVNLTRDQILERFSQSGKTILLVGHAVNGSKLLGVLTGYDMIDEEPRYPFYLFNTGLFELKQNPDTGKIKVTDYSLNHPPLE